VAATAVTTTVALICMIGALAAPASASVPTADLSLTGQSQRVPFEFFGLSVEDKEIAKYESAGVLFDRMISLFREQDGSPMLFRLGGRSADEVVWHTKTPHAPRYEELLTPDWVSQLGALARRNHLHIELDLNMAVHSPRMAVAFAKAVHKALPGRFAGVAMGNEPDLYRLESWLDKERIPSTMRSTPRHWAENYTPQKYVREYTIYAKAILKAFPGIRITAPELTYPSLEWPTDLFGLGKLAPEDFSFHRYATATCKRVNSHAPTTSAFLSERYTGGLAKTLGTDIAFAHQHGHKLRVTEMGSVTCGGRKHLAESFATALWAPDALFEMMRAGVDGINWHIRPSYPNAPFHIVSGAVQAFPEAYGLAIFAQMIGPRARLEQVGISSSSTLALKAWAVRSRKGLKLLLLNKGDTDIVTHLQLGNRRRPAKVSRLVAPNLDSRTGVTFGGQSIGPDGRWQGRLRQITVTPSNNNYRVRLPAYSAALVDF
jgi:hypothetical protein